MTHRPKPSMPTCRQAAADAFRISTTTAVRVLRCCAWCERRTADTPQTLARAWRERNRARRERSVLVLRRQPDQLGQQVLEFGIDLQDVVRQRLINRRRRPAEQEPAVQSIFVANESARQFVGLKATDQADQQIVDGEGFAIGHALDHEPAAVPAFEIEWLASRSTSSR